MTKFSQNKTKLLIAGEENRTQAAELILYIINYLGKEIDHQTSFSTQSNQSDFILYEGEEDNFDNYHPNIVLITSSGGSSNYGNLLKTIVSGGVLIYNEADESLKSELESVSTFFRKLPFTTPNFQKDSQGILLETDLGEIPLAVSPESNFDYISGVKLLGQQLGIMEEEFYEALLTYSFN